MADRYVRALADGGAVRIIAIDATEAARHTQQAHGLGLGATKLGADLGVAALLMGAHIKGDERITLQVQSEAPRAAAIAEVSADGVLRARVTPSDLPDAPLHGGLLLAIKSDGTKEVYRGMTAVEGSVADALSQHLGHSSQVDVAVHISHDVEGDGVSFSGGVLVERMPYEKGRPSMTSEQFAAKYAQLDDDVLNRALFGVDADGPLDVLESGPVTWRCQCSVDKVESMLLALGPDELRAMREEDGGAEVTCHFCNTARHISGERLAALEQSLR